MLLSSLLLPGEYTGNADAATLSVENVTACLDRVQPGTLFVCLRGTRYDAHLLLPAVARAGACAAVVQDGAAYTVPEGLPVFSVSDTRRIFPVLCDRLAGHPTDGMTLIAVTGTNGKTSTALMIREILHAADIPSAVIGTVCCRSDVRDYTPPIEQESRRTMTTPDPDILYPMLRQMKEDGVTHVVMEASSHALALKKLAPLRFAFGIFTNLSPEHLDFHGTMENYLAAKASLFHLCDNAVINFDSEYATDLARRVSCRVFRCGAVYHEQYNAGEIVSHGARGVSYVYHAPDLRMTVSLPIPGTFTVYNSLLAITCAIGLGVRPTVARDALAAMRGVPGRLERVPLDPARANFTVFIDYAHTEAALRNLLTTVRSFRESGERIVLLFGCGGDRDRSKRGPMGRAAEELSDLVIVTSDNCRTEEPTRIIRDILSGMSNPAKRRVIVNRESAITYAIRAARPKDIILLVGKGHETYELSGGEARPFDEKAIVRAALQNPRIPEETDEDPT